MSNCPSLRSARRCLINWSAPSSQAPCALQAKQLRKTLPRLVFKEANPKTSVESRSKYKKKILLLQNCFCLCSMNSFLVLYRDKNSNNTIYESDMTVRLWHWTYLAIPCNVYWINDHRGKILKRWVRSHREGAPPFLWWTFLFFWRKKKTSKCKDVNWIVLGEIQQPCSDWQRGAIISQVDILTTCIL